MEDILKSVQEFTKEILMNGVNSNDITMETDIKSDLGFDSLDQVELAILLERRYQVSIPDDQVDKLSSVKEICELVQSLIDLKK